MQHILSATINYDAGLACKMSLEYKTLNNCIEQLESSLKLDIAGITHFLYREGFIAEGLYEKILDPNYAFSEADKATQLVFKIRDSVKLDSSKYHKLINHFRQNRHLDGIVQVLDGEYFGIGKLTASEGLEGMFFTNGRHRPPPSPGVPL